MVQYNFKSITVVPDSNSLIDIVLSRTQRQTPTVVHKGWPISRIRQFYMRKVRYTHQNYVDKLSTIVDEFPRIDTIHPFYGDFLNVLYDKDHYKIALDEVNKAKNLIINVSRDYVKMLKYGDSLYRCKCLKVAALGRMSTVIKGMNTSLTYLENVRQHLSRLPSIDTGTRTIILCGHPNVGKSSFMNRITRADVDVQPYAFTTKSLFVGHTEYKYLRYQVIDTPGLLDRPLEQHNVMEMLSITALAHLQAVVLFFLDVSGSCGYSIAEQAALFHSIKPLFAKKPVIIVCNKADLQVVDGLSTEDKELVMKMKAETMNAGDEEAGVVLTMSSLTGEGVSDVKKTACQMILDQRVKEKVKSERCSNRLHMGVVRPRDDRKRPLCIPQEVAMRKKIRTEKDLEEENGGADSIPELLDGHNVSDFATSENVENIERFLKQEEGMGKEESDDDDDDDVMKLSEEEERTLAVIRKMKASLIRQHRMKKSVGANRASMPRKYDKDMRQKRMGRQLSALGLDPSKAIISRARVTRKRRWTDGDRSPVDMADDVPNKKRRCSTDEASSKEGKMNKAVTLAKKAFKKRNKDARRGEADRVIPSLKPKHLVSGKRSIGKNQRR